MGREYHHVYKEYYGWYMKLTQYIEERLFHETNKLARRNKQIIKKDENTKIIKYDVEYGFTFIKHLEYDSQTRESKMTYFMGVTKED